MKNIVKLHATASTNDYLRSRFRESELPNLYTITTMSQSQGKGQRGASWETEAGKNLVFSTLYVNDKGLTAFEISKFISVLLSEFIENTTGLSAKIKWPNDILSGNKKIAGILIENIFKKGKLTHSIIGIGLNVNQVFFENLPQASSLLNLSNTRFNIDSLLDQFIEELKDAILNPDSLIKRYENRLFKYLEYADFQFNDQIITAKVTGTDAHGKLLLYTKGKTHSFDLKEIKWIY